MYHQRSGILFGKHAPISYLPVLTFTIEKYHQTRCVQFMVRPTKRLDMHSGSVPWPETCGRWLKEDCRSVGSRCRVFTSQFDSQRRSSWGRRWKLGQWWPGPFGMLGTDFALKKNSPNQGTSSEALQLFCRTISN